MSKKHKKVCRVLNYIDHGLLYLHGVTCILKKRIVGQIFKRSFA